MRKLALSKVVVREVAVAVFLLLAALAALASIWWTPWGNSADAAGSNAAVVEEAWPDEADASLVAGFVEDGGVVVLHHDDEAGRRGDVVKVVGYGEGKLANDRARVQLGVEVSGDDYGDVGRDVHKLLGAVSDLLVVSGADEDDVETIHAAVRREYESYTDDRGVWQRSLVGYRGYGSVVAELNSVEATSSVIGSVYENYGDSVTVEGFWFYLEDDDAVERVARKDAVEDMRVRAEQLATFSGRSLGRLLSIGEPAGKSGFRAMGDRHGDGYGAMKSAVAESSSGHGGYDEVPLSFGKSERTVVIEGVYALE